VSLLVAGSRKGGFGKGAKPPSLVAGGGGTRWWFPFEPRTYCFLQRTLEKGGVERGFAPSLGCRR